MDPISRVKADLRTLDEQGLLRVRRGARPDGDLIDVCSNDYLGYARGSVSRETQTNTGARASRLIGGTHPAHELLERELAAWVDLPDALLFSSGYAANLGVLSALGGPGRVIISDEFNHASIIDGCRLSRARIVVVPHRDLRAVEQALAAVSSDESAWVVTESYFSMDADSPDLQGLRAACDRVGAALYVDEAHALGVFGPEGAGLCRAADIRPDVLVGTLGKAVGVQGAFVAAGSDLLDFVWNRARSFVFSTAPSPRLATLALENVRRARTDDEGRSRLDRFGARLQEALSGKLSADRHGPVFPVVVGSPEKALRAAATLEEHGFYAVAIRPPTVPAGASRLRVSLRADLRDDDVARLATVLRRCLES